MPKKSKKRLRPKRATTNEREIERGQSKTEGCTVSKKGKGGMRTGKRSYSNVTTKKMEWGSITESSDLLLVGVCGERLSKVTHSLAEI